MARRTGTGMARCCGSAVRRRQVRAVGRLHPTRSPACNHTEHITNGTPRRASTIGQDTHATNVHGTSVHGTYAHTRVSDRARMSDSPADQCPRHSPEPRYRSRQPLHRARRDLQQCTTAAVSHSTIASLANSHGQVWALHQCKAANNAFTNARWECPHTLIQVSDTTRLILEHRNRKCQTGHGTYRRCAHRPHRQPPATR